MAKALQHSALTTKKIIRLPVFNHPKRNVGACTENKPACSEIQAYIYMTTIIWMAVSIITIE